ncbi:mannose-1-phosphate guanylyltransferase [Roseibium salinum]|uniref:Sugar phosphate nucleotidyltransferase n=1 Tax=Roseibium salinum TaxID=1604349 RepID=A0ABT3QWP5_9HYPH|nr:sugar phosphate nucleotidyltransferase [Roseibium sp. DSM 29163]MCX2721347.1 sugar phosphate nucleotidyltransferase [Roseibium sp. DSM 29163]
MQRIYPVILSGGMGSRLWPMSRRLQPKQFQPANGVDGPSFLQATVERHRSEIFHEPTIVGAEAQLPLLKQQTEDIGCAARLIGEPVGRNTGPAVLAAALDLLRNDPDAVMLVLPSDHVISGSLNQTTEQMLRGALEGWIVTLGVTARYPETGFGYITRGTLIDSCPGLNRVAAFVEKPDRERAAQLLVDGLSCWASGISMMRAERIIEEFERYQPDTLATVRRALDGGSEGPDRVLLEESAFSGALNAPTESAIFERSSAMAAAEADISWNDVGAWTAVHSIGEKTADGNVQSGEVLAVDTHNSLIRAQDRLVAVVGMDDVIVVDTPDAVLVTSHKSAQQVKQAVAWLQKHARSEAETHAHSAGHDTGIRRLCLPPGRVGEVDGREGGTVVTVASGVARAKVGETLTTARPGEIFLVQPRQLARLASVGDEDLVLVAVAITENRKKPARRKTAQPLRKTGSEPEVARAARHQTTSAA